MAQAFQPMLWLELVDRGLLCAWKHHSKKTLSNSPTVPLQCTLV